MHRLLLSVVLVGCQAGQMASNTDVSNTPDARLAQRERAAEAAGKIKPLAAALSAAVEAHTDGRPIVDRFHLRASAKALQELEK